jgi:hypothetical protein
MRLNKVSIILDGTPISRDDIYEVTFGTTIEEVNVEKTLGKPFHTLSSEAGKDLTIVVKGQSRGQYLLSQLIEERRTDPQYHNISVYDGIQTTQQFIDCLLSNYSSEINKDTGLVTYSYVFSALDAKVTSTNV